MFQIHCRRNAHILRSSCSGMEAGAGGGFRHTSTLHQADVLYFSFLTSLLSLCQPRPYQAGVENIYTLHNYRTLYRWVWQWSTCWMDNSKQQTFIGVERRSAVCEGHSQRSPVQTWHDHQERYLSFFVSWLTLCIYNTGWHLIIKHVNKLFIVLYSMPLGNIRPHDDGPTVCSKWKLKLSAFEILTVYSYSQMSQLIFTIIFFCNVGTFT